MPVGHATEYVGTVMAVAVLSHVLAVNTTIEKHKKSGTTTLIKAFLTFFIVSLCYFPISLMLGGARYRERFFRGGV